MTPERWAAALGLAGTVTQLGGVLLVIWDLIDARRTARAAPLRPHRTIAVRSSLALGLTGPPTLERRVDQLEAAIQNVLTEKFGEVYHAIQQRDELSLGRDDDVRALIADLAGSHMARRTAAAALVVGGTGLVLVAAVVLANAAW